MAISCKENMWGSWSCSPCGKYGGTQINTDSSMTLEAAEMECNNAAMSVPNSNPYPTNEITKKNKYKTREKMGRHLRNATAIRVNNFNAQRGSNSTCQQFNGGTMFESEQGVFSGFQGNSTNTDGTFAFASVPQGFSRASGIIGGGCPSGCTPCLIGGGCCEGGYGNGAKCSGAAKQVAVAKAMGKNCQDGTQCAVGETCRNGECVPFRAADARKKKTYSTQADAPAAKQTSSGCIKSQCGSKHPNNYNCYDGDGNNGGCGCSDKRSGTCMKGGGGARIYTDAEIMADIRRSGRKAPRTLAPMKRKAQGGSPSSDFFNCPKGKCWGGKKCVPCTDGTPDSAAFGGKNVYARNFGGGSVYSRNFGGKNIF